MDSKTHMYKDILGVTNRFLEKYLGETTSEFDAVTKGIAGIISSRMRIFVRPMPEADVYRLVSDIPALKKTKAKDRHAIAKAIKIFVE